MEKQIKATFITPFYGSAPSLGAQALLEKHIDDVNNKAFLSYLGQITKKGEKAIDKAAEILTVFHRDKDGNPVLGNWMLHRCLVCTGLMIFNAMKNKSHPKKELIENAILYVAPVPHISLFNGKRVTNPSGIQTHTVSLVKKNRSFFTAYEWIPAGTCFEADIVWDEEMLSEEHMNQVIAKAGNVGVGAFRQRFGKFEIQK